MTISSWRNTALTSLLSSVVVVVVSGQQVIFIPLSSSTTTGNDNINNVFGGGGGRGDGGVAAEPPCRQRRLEPWRQQVREQCLVEAEAHCGTREERGLLRRDEEASYISLMSSSSPFVTLEKEMDSFFGDLVALQRSSPSSNVQSQDEEDDPFDRLFHDMLGFSLRAFDQMMMDNVAPPSADGVEEDDEGGERSADEDETDDLAFDDMWEDEESSGDYLYAYRGEFLEYAATPEQAAESALDVMVASLARSAAVDLKDAAAGEEKEEEEKGDEEVGASSSIISVNNLPQRLFQLGNDLLAESHTRRRLMEEGGEKIAVDPHLQVKERLARRLTEYRTDLFYSPDGTITLYTMTGSFPSSTFLSGGEPALGMGSSDLDECVRSRFDNRDLEGGCRRAVGEFLLAVDHGSAESPHYQEFATVSEEYAIQFVRELVLELPNRDPHECSALGAAIFGFVLLFIALMVNKSFSRVEEQESDEDDANEFDYAALPEDDAEECPAREGEARAFVGVPVQVV